VTKEIRERKTITIDPLLGMDDVHALMTFFESTLFQHWRLFRYAVCTPRSVDLQQLDIFMEDVPAELPSLVSGIPLADHNRHDQQRALWRTASDALTATFDDATRALGQLQSLYRAETRVAREQDDLHRRRDLEAAMTPNEYDRALKILDTALLAAVQKRGDQQSLGKRLERAEAAVVKAEVPSPPAATTKSGASKK